MIDEVPQNYGEAGRSKPPGTKLEEAPSAYFPLTREPVLGCLYNSEILQPSLAIGLVCVV